MNTPATIAITASIIFAVFYIRDEYQQRTADREKITLLEKTLEAQQIAQPTPDPTPTPTTNSDKKDWFQAHLNTPSRLDLSPNNKSRATHIYVPSTYAPPSDFPPTERRVDALQRVGGGGY